VISKPAETVLLKRLRQLGFDPSALDVSHIGSGGGLYLLELFVTAAQQEALSDTALLTALLDEADSLGSMSKEAAMSRLHRPVLMVSLWDNQEEGLNEWLDNGRHGILEMATATGKTVAGIAAIAECCGVLPEDPDHEPRTDDAKIAIVAHSNAILKQWEQEIQEKARSQCLLDRRVNRQRACPLAVVEFYTAQSLLPRYDRDLADQYDLVIYDEVHHYSNLDGYGAAIDRPNYRAAMGLSATIGDDGELKREQLTELLGDVVHTYGVEDARRDGIIPEFDWTVHPTPLDPYERKNGMRRQSRSPTNSSTFGGRQQPSGFSDRFLFRLPNSKTSGTSFAHTRRRRWSLTTRRYPMNGRTSRRRFIRGPDPPPITAQDRRGNRTGEGLPRGSGPACQARHLRDGHRHG